MALSRRVRDLSNEVNELLRDKEELETRISLLHKGMSILTSRLVGVEKSLYEHDKDMFPDVRDARGEVVEGFDSTSLTVYDMMSESLISSAVIEEYVDELMSRESEDLEIMEKMLTQISLSSRRPKREDTSRLAQLTAPDMSLTALLSVENSVRKDKRTITPALSPLSLQTSGALPQQTQRSQDVVDTGNEQVSSYRPPISPIDEHLSGEVQDPDMFPIGALFDDADY